MFKLERRLYQPKELIVKNGGPLAVSICSIYNGLKDGSIPFSVVGNRKLIPYWYVEDLLRNKSVLERF